MGQHFRHSILFSLLFPCLVLGQTGANRDDQEQQARNAGTAASAVTGGGMNAQVGVMLNASLHVIGEAIRLKNLSEQGGNGNGNSGSGGDVGRAVGDAADQVGRNADLAAREVQEAQGRRPLQDVIDLGAGGLTGARDVFDNKPKNENQTQSDPGRLSNPSGNNNPQPLTKAEFEKRLEAVASDKIDANGKPIWDNGKDVNESIQKAFVERREREKERDENNDGEKPLKVKHGEVEFGPNELGRDEVARSRGLFAADSSRVLLVSSSGKPTESENESSSSKKPSATVDSTRTTSLNPSSTSTSLTNFATERAEEKLSAVFVTKMSGLTGADFGVNGEKRVSGAAKSRVENVFLKTSVGRKFEKTEKNNDSNKRAITDRILSKGIRGIASKMVKSPPRVANRVISSYRLARAKDLLRDSHVRQPVKPVSMAEIAGSEIRTFFELPTMNAFSEAFDEVSRQPTYAAIPFEEDVAWTALSATALLAVVGSISARLRRKRGFA